MSQRPVSELGSGMYCDEGALRRFVARSPRHDARSANGGPAGRIEAGPRLAIYSHDAQGLGHLRRNLLITRAVIAAGLSPSVLMLSGLREAASYEFPPGVDSVTLPSLAKDQNGDYSPRSLPLAMSRVMEIRRSIITGAIGSLSPQVLIVDKLPLGIFNELESSLAALRSQGRTRTVLGLRDILDDGASVRAEWERGGYVDAIRRYYDEVWVYGDRRVCDVAAEYGLPDDVGSKIRYVGYLNPRDLGEIGGATQPQSAHRLPRGMDLPAGSLTLCLVGGGRDGVALANAFLDAPLPRSQGAVLVCGPLMSFEDRSELRAKAHGRDDIRIIEFITDPQPLMCCADRIVCMGGYNSICEALAFHKPALVVPRIKPRREQLVRAERFAKLDLIDVLHPGELDGAAIGRWIRERPRSRPIAEDTIDFQGVHRLPDALRRVLRESPPLKKGEPMHV